MIKKLFILASWLLLSQQNIMSLSPDVISRIGKQIWHNEASCREDYLTYWSDKESFPSFGIGHSIWIPQGHEVKYTQGFHPLCEHLKDNGIILPSWLEDSLSTGAPWQNRTDFYNDQEKLQELRKLFSSTVAHQAQFMVIRLKNKLPEIINAAPKSKRKKVKRIIDLMLSSAIGTYVLVDYLNFKGDGLNPAEQSNGKSWGLLSVLLDMPENLTQTNVTKAFTVAATKKLLMLIEHSGPDYNRLNFFGGWITRLNTYTKKSI
ncbi:MAG: hypothetical protein NTU89_02950 [Candidatus Dependentiae bacterium]|nr:hypothetical protein [Candidatus Dependentiae bacterium]